MIGNVREKFTEWAQAIWRTNRSLAIWLVLAAAVAVTFIQPIRTTGVRYFLLLGALSLWLTSVAVIKVRAPRILIALAGLVLAAAPFLPTRPVDKQRLRGDYVSALRSYRGSPYVWGGETHVGIDCSGLVRCALMEACLKDGVLTQNGTLTREAVSLWLQDASASSLYQGYRRKTIRLFDAETINSIPPASIEPGDFIVTGSEVHTMAYLGKGEWIQASPDLDAMRVITNRTPERRDAYFDQNVHVLRWALLSDTPPVPLPPTIRQRPK